MPDMRHPSGIQGAFHPSCAVAQHVSVDHRRRDVSMTKQLLHRADVVAALEQVRGERVTERVARNPFVHA